LLVTKKELEKLGHKVHIEPTDLFSVNGKLYIIREISELEYARPTEEVNYVINRGRVSDLKFDREQLIENGWYKPEEIKIELDYVASAARSFTELVKAAALPDSLYEYNSPISGRLVVTRRNIGTGYCNLPLKFMVEHARKQSITIAAKIDKRINIILGSKFDGIEKSLRSYMAKKGFTGSEPSDWNILETAEAEFEGITDFRHDHCHMSSRFKTPVLDAGFTPRFEGGLRRRFYYDG
jgi:hypothetical protein